MGSNKIQTSRRMHHERELRAKESKGKMLSTSLFTFKDSERSEFLGKVIEAIGKLQLDAMILFDPDHLMYLTGIDLPYAEQYLDYFVFYLYHPNTKKQWILCPPDWVDVVKDQGWSDEIVEVSSSQDEPERAFGAHIKTILSESMKDGDRIGIDSYAMPEKLFQEISETLNTFELQSIDKAISDIRMIKTAFEIDLLEEACRHSDRGFVSALNHAEGNVQDALNYDLWEFAERIRVHVGEFAGSGTGHLMVVQGDDAQIYYQPPRDVFCTGNFLRAELTNHHRGYWSNAARTFFVGHPNEQQQKSYAENITLKKEAEKYLVAGKKCCDIAKHLVDFADSAGISLWDAPGFGHGIGVSEREAPFLTRDDPTELKTGMVLVLSIYTHGPERELLCSKDTFEITSNSPRLMSWYKDWDKLYNLFGNTARHG